LRKTRKDARKRDRVRCECGCNRRKQRNRQLVFRRRVTNALQECDMDVSRRFANVACSLMRMFRPLRACLAAGCWPGNTARHSPSCLPTHAATHLGLKQRNVQHRIRTFDIRVYYLLLVHDVYCICILSTWQHAAIAYTQHATPTSASEYRSICLGVSMQGQ
jgi:hypothetical protein